MSATAEKTLADIHELKSLGASLKEAADALKAPAHVGSDGASLAYWGGEESVEISPAVDRSRSRGVLKSLPSALPREYKPRTVWKSSGEFLRDGFVAHKEGRKDEWTAKHRASLEPITKAIQGMSTQVAVDGGALVLPEFNTTIMERVYDNAIWSATDQYTVTGNNMTFVANAETSRVTGSRAGGLQAYWADEGGAVTDSKPTFRKFGLKLKKLMIVVYLTDELIEDSGTAIQQYVSRKVGEEFNWMLGNAVFRGTGTGQPLGIYNSPNLLTITKETGQLAATLD